MEEGRRKKRSYEMEPPRKKKTRKTWAEGIRGVMGEKGINRRRLE